MRLAIRLASFTGEVMFCEGTRLKDRRQFEGRTSARITNTETGIRCAAVSPCICCLPSLGETQNETRVLCSRSKMARKSSENRRYFAND